MVKIEGEERIEKELAAQNKARAGMYFIGAVFVLVSSIMGIFNTSNDSFSRYSSYLGLLIAFTLYLKGKNRIRRSSNQLGRNNRIRRKKFNRYQ